MKRGLVIFFILVIVVSSFTGCVITDQTRTKTEGTAVGAGGGALIGGLAGSLYGGSITSTILGAGIGALVGGAAGYAYGAHVANEKEKYTRTEDWLDACIASLDAVNKETINYNKQLAQDIKDMDATTDKLANEYQNKKVNKAALEKEKKKIDAKLKLATERLDRAKFELENQLKVLKDAKKEVGQGEYIKALDEKIVSLKKYISELESIIEELASLSSRMTV